MSTLLDAQTEVHVQLGNGAPAFVPTAIGQHYIDIANKRVYQSSGLNAVEDWGTPLATLEDLAKLDFAVDKADIGLGNVEDYGIATQEEAAVGEVNDRYMTPLRTVDLMNALFKPALDNFIARTDNPHQVTADQVGALTVAQTEALLAEKLNSGDLAGLLQVFWSEKVGGAPETLDTIEEIAQALQNNPEVIDALQVLVEGNRLTIVEAMDAIAALQALVGESTAFLTAESDLGVNPVALASDVTTEEVMVLVDSDETAGELRITRTVEGVSVERKVEGVWGVVDTLDAETQTAFDEFMAGVEEGDFVKYVIVDTTNRQVLGDARDLKAILDSLEAKNVAQDQAMATDRSQIQDQLDEKATIEALNSAVTALNQEIESQGVATAASIATVSDALNAFIAAKASGAEAIAGEDDVKYITALALKEALDALDLSGKLDVTGNLDQTTVSRKEYNEDTGEWEVIEQVLLTSILGQLRGDMEAADDVLGGRIDAANGAREQGDQVLDLKIDNAVQVLEGTKVGRTDNVDFNTITEGEGEEAVQVSLATLIAQLKSGIAQAGDASALEALQQAFNAFVAAKASSAEVLEGLDDTKYTTSVGVKAAIDTAITELVDGAPEALDTINELAAALQNNPDVITALQTLVSENASALGLVADRVTAIEAELPNKVDQGGDITDNTVVVSESAVALGELITQLQSAIAQAGDASALEALQQAFNAFVAAKATSEEAITGTDDEKYLTSLSAKAAIAAAVAELVGTAPEALDTINELAAALNNDPDIINTLMTQVGSKETPEGAQAKVDAALAIARDEIASLTESVDVRTTLVEDRVEALETDIQDKASIASVDLKLDKTGNADQVTLTVEEAQVALADVVAQLRAGIAQAGDATELEAVRDLLNAFIAGKATAEEAIAGLDNVKYMTAAGTKAAFDARWAEKVGSAPETLDTIEELAAALRNAPDALDALETVTKAYTDDEVLAAIAQISGEDMEAGTTLASLYADIQVLRDEKLDATATAVNAEKLEGKSLMEVIDAAVQPGRLFYPVVHVNGNLDDSEYVMPTPAAIWAQVKTNAVLEQVDTVYAIAVKRLLPGNLLAMTSQEGMTLVGAVSAAQEGPEYVIMRANVEATEWEVLHEPMLGCLARLSKHCVVVGDNTDRFVPGQTLFYNGFEALSEGVYYDWTLLADKEWEVATFTGTELVIESARYHRSEIRIQSLEPVSISVDVETDLPFEMEVRVVNMTGVPVTFIGDNVTSVPRMEEYTMTKVNGLVRIVRYTNTTVSVAGDLDEAFFENPDYVAAE